MNSNSQQMQIMSNLPPTPTTPKNEDIEEDEYEELTEDDVEILDVDDLKIYEINKN